jgi:hypothetical protein
MRLYACSGGALTVALKFEIFDLEGARPRVKARLGTRSYAFGAQSFAPRQPWRLT